MNLKDFSLLKEDNESYEIGHPQGNSMTIPKAGLSTKAQTLISELKQHQNFVEGGNVDDDKKDPEPTPSPTPSIPINVDNPQMPASMLNPNVSAADEQNANTIPGSSETASAPPTPASVAPAADPNLSQAPALGSSPDLNNAIATDIGAQQAQATAETKAGKQEAGTQYALAKQLTDASSPLDLFTQNQDKDASLEQAVMSKSIDPDRLWNSKSGASKFSTILGVLIGGLGGSQTTLQMLRQNVQDDIAAQQNDQSKAMNLWKMNRENLGSAQAATLATENQYNSIAQAKLKAAAAGTMGPQAAANAAAAIVPLEQARMQNNKMLALMKFNSQPGSSPIDPSQLIPYVSHDPAQQKAIAEEIGKAQNISMNRNKMLNYFDQASKENTVLRTGAGLLREPASVMALHQTMLPNFKQIDGTVRQAAMDETFHNLTPAPGDTDTKIALKRQALNDWMQSETAAPIAKSVGLDLQKYQSTRAHADTPGSSDQQAQAWAMANPNDPRSAKIMQQLGGSRQ